MNRVGIFGASGMMRETGDIVWALGLDPVARVNAFKDCPCMELAGALSLSQRLINIPSSSGLVQGAP